MFIEEYRTLEFHINQNMNDKSTLLDCLSEYRDGDILSPFSKMLGSISALKEVLTDSIIEMMKTIYKKFISSDSIYDLQVSKGLLSGIRKKAKGGFWYDRIYEELTFEVVGMLYEKAFKTFVGSKSSGINKD